MTIRKVTFEIEQAHQFILSSQYFYENLTYNAKRFTVSKFIKTCSWLHVNDANRFEEVMMAKYKSKGFMTVGQLAKKMAL